MYSEAKNGWKGFSCRSHDAWSKLIKTDANGIGLRIWGNRSNQSERYMAYCKSDENAYPYEQHYANPYELLPRADPNNNVVYSDTFYKPKQIKTVQEQVEKWSSAYFWFFTPLPLIVFLSNSFWILWDLIDIPDPKKMGLYPHLYSNKLAAFFLEDKPMLELFGIFKWYDMFSIRGFDNWFWDAFTLVFIPWYDLLMLLFRIYDKNWSFGATEENNNIDMNRLFAIEGEHDAFDYNYYSNKADGQDCNANYGKGYYCFCRKEGFRCTCDYNSNFIPGEPIMTCFDHYGYDCQGQYVDGEEYWC